MLKNITLLNRDQAILTPLKKLSKEVEEAKKECDREEKQRDKKISTLIKEKLKSGEITLHQIGLYAQEQRSMPWSCTHPKAIEYKNWENADFFQYSLKLAPSFIKRDIPLQLALFDQVILVNSQKTLDHFLESQPLERQVEVLHYILEELIYQQQLVGYLETLSLLDEKNRAYLNTYDHESEFYESFESLLKESFIKDPQLFFPLVQFAQYVKEGLQKTIDEVHYDFDRYYSAINDINQLKKFRKNLHADEEKLFGLIEFLLNFLRCKVNLEKLNYIKVSYYPILEKYSEYKFHLSQGFSYPTELLSLQRFFIFLNLSKSHFSFSRQLKEFKNCKLIKGNSFDKQLYDFNSSLTHEGVTIGEEYKKRKAYLESIYLHCHEKLKVLRQIDKNLETNFWNSFLEGIEFKPSLESYNPSLFNLDYIDRVFKEEFEKRKVKKPLSPFLLEDLNAALTRKISKQPTCQKSAYPEAAPEMQAYAEPPSLEDSFKGAIEHKESTPWQEVPQLGIDRFRKKCPFTYHPRVARWFLLSLDSILPESLFPEYKDKSPEQLFKAQLFHSLPQEIDAYVKMGKSITSLGSLHPLKSGNEVAKHCYSFIAVPGKISYQLQVYHGLVLYKINDEKQLCIHRCFHESHSANELLQTFMFPEKVLDIIDKLPQENLELSSEKTLTSPCSTMSSIEPQIKKEKHSLIVKDPRGFTIELFSTKI